MDTDSRLPKLRLKRSTRRRLEFFKRMAFSFFRKKEAGGTHITIFQNRNQEFLGFDCTGHAGYDVRGKDIVCAGISVLVINTMNALERLTDEGYTGEMDGASGDIHFRFKAPASHDADLLMRAMVLGLEGIQASYGKEYLKLKYEEV